MAAITVWATVCNSIAKGSMYIPSYSPTVLEFPGQSQKLTPAYCPGSIQNCHTMACTCIIKYKSDCEWLWQNASGSEVPNHFLRKEQANGSHSGAGTTVILDIPTYTNQGWQVCCSTSWITHAHDLYTFIITSHVLYAQTWTYTTQKVTKTLLYICSQLQVFLCDIQLWND